MKNECWQLRSGLTNKVRPYSSSRCHKLPQPILKTTFSKSYLKIDLHTGGVLYTGFQTCNFIKKRLQRRCFPVKFTKLLRTPIL